MTSFNEISEGELNGERKKEREKKEKTRDSQLWVWLLMMKNVIQYTLIYTNASHKSP